jgi:hypothetical protein
MPLIKGKGVMALGTYSPATIIGSWGLIVEPKFTYRNHEASPLAWQAPT